MITPKEISKVFTTRQLYRYKTGSKEIKVGDLVVFRLRDEPTVYNGYSSAIHSYFAEVNDITKKLLIQDKYDTIYRLSIFDNGVKSTYDINSWQLISIIPISISDDVYAKAKKAYDKKKEKEAKTEVERIERERQLALALEAAEKEEERQREEAEKAKIIAEENRRAEPMLITVGMWEDLMKRLRELENNVSDMEGTVHGLRHYCYGPGLDE